MTQTDSIPEADSRTQAGVRAPAFQFYPSDYLSDAKTRIMSFAQRGMYWDLYCHCWLQGGLPLDPMEIAGILGIKAAAKFVTQDWPMLSRCFRVTDQDHQHPRIELELAKQEAYRRRQSDNGRSGGRPRKPAHNPEKPTALSGFVQTDPPAVAADNPEKALHLLSSSLSSDFVKSVRTAAAEPPDARSGRPIFKGQRLAVFEWMLDDLRRMLGPHFDAFDVHEWFYTLDAKIVSQALVLPPRDGGLWLKSETLAEASRRGLPIATAAEPPSQPPMNEDNVRKVVEGLAAERAARRMR